MRSLFCRFLIEEFVDKAYELLDKYDMRQSVEVLGLDGIHKVFEDSRFGWKSFDMHMWICTSSFALINVLVFWFVETEWMRLSSRRRPRLTRNSSKMPLVPVGSFAVPPQQRNSPHLRVPPVSWSFSVSGKAVFCEKPLATSIEATKSCYDAAAKANLPLFCAFNRSVARLSFSDDL